MPGEQAELGMVGSGNRDEIDERSTSAPRADGHRGIGMDQAAVSSTGSGRGVYDGAPGGPALYKQINEG